MQHHILQSDYAGISVKGNTTATVIPLVEAWTKCTVFDTNSPSRGSAGDQANDAIGIGASGDYAVAVSIAAKALGAVKAYEANVFELGPAVTITGATAADPVVVTAVAHGFSDGDKVAIKAVGGMVELDDRIFTIANKADDTFELTDDGDTDIDGTGFTAYTTGGTVHLATELSIHTQRMQTTTSVDRASSAFGIASLTAGNTVELYMKGVTDATNITSASLDLSIMRVG